MDTVTQDRPAHHGLIMFGILIMAAGMLMLIDRLEIANVHVTTRLWPLFPLGLGLLRMIDPPVGRNGCLRSRRSGAWLVFIGCWGLANELHVLGLGYGNSWPLLVVFAGLNIVWRSIEGPSRPGVQVPASAERREP